VFAGAKTAVGVGTPEIGFGDVISISFSKSTGKSVYFVAFTKVKTYL
jgi:hypothetical protein